MSEFKPTIRHVEPLIESNRAFANCKLDREKYADVLTSIVNNYKDGFVLAINNEWGAGKTTFVKMWQQKLEDQEFKTLYFNAWENDFDTNPLVALLAELKTISRNEDDQQFKSLVKKGAAIAKSLIPNIAKAIAKRYIDTEALVEAIEKTAEGVAEILKEEVDEFASKKQSLKDFRIQLEQFVKTKVDIQPLVFIIDELDRCRPSYAVELLEQVKHFFSVPGIVFVLSIDKVQLGYAVRGFYGSEQIDSGKYLQRFIDLEFTIPQPDIESYLEYLFEYFGIKLFFENDKRIREYDFANDSSHFIATAISLLKHTNLTLRDYDKLFSYASIGLKSFRSNGIVIPELYFVLVFIRQFHLELFKRIQNKQLALQELILDLEKVFPNEIPEQDRQIYLYIEAQIVWSYNQSCIYSYGDRLFIRNSANGQIEPSVYSTIDNSPNSEVFKDWISRIDRGSQSVKVGIDYLINKVSLFEQIVVA